MTTAAHEPARASTRADLSRRWTPHVQRAAWLMTAIGVFLAPPPVGILTLSRRQLAGLTSFIVAVLTGLILLWMQRRSERVHVRFWSIITGVCLVGGLASLVAYESARETWTVPYAGARILRGTTYTPLARRALADHQMADSALVAMAAGDTKLVWEEQSFPGWETRSVLLGGYLIGVILFATCILAIGQAHACSARPES
jgi:hypothetical protein